MLAQIIGQCWNSDCVLYTLESVGTKVNCYESSDLIRQEFNVQDGAYGIYFSFKF